MDTLFLFIDIIIAYFIDLLVGDPYWLPHPVRFIGLLVKKTEIVLKRFIDRNAMVNGHFIKRERLAGGILMLVVTFTIFLVVFLILKIAGAIHPIVFHIVNIYFIYSSLATKCLAVEARKIYELLSPGNLPEARKQLSMLVGRQTEHLNEEEAAKAVVETTAENTVDGVVSPLFYAVLGTFFGLGAPLVYAFKAISTLDSMVGYMNDKYINFGRISAKTDDAANYIPARLSGIMIPVASAFCGLNISRSFNIMKRDRRNHKSPNCAYPEAAFAGALGIMLGGTNIYFGKAMFKPTIGDAGRAIEKEDILKSIRLLYTSSLLSMLVFIGLAGLVLLLVL